MLSSALVRFLCYEIPEGFHGRQAVLVAGLILRHKYQTAVNAKFHYVLGRRFFRNHFYQVWLAPFVVEPWICREYLISFHTAPQ